MENQPNRCNPTVQTGCNLTVATVVYNDLEGLERTINSVDTQLTSPFEHLIVASGFNKGHKTKLLTVWSAPSRRYMFDKDSSLYNAMNIALSCARGNCILFLNAGDIFFNDESVSSVYRVWQPNTCLLFRKVLKFQDLAFVRPKRERLESLIKSPGHQGFIAPLPKQRKHTFYYQQEQFRIESDSIWMRQNIEHYGYVLTDTILTEFSLGGLSNLPTLKLVRARFEEDGYFQAFKAAIKVALKFFLGLRRFYVLIYSWKYARIK